MYQNERRKLFLDVKNLVEMALRQGGKTLSFSGYVHRVALRYGFGKPLVKRAFEVFINQKLVTIDEEKDIIEIKIISNTEENQKPIK